MRPGLSLRIAAAAAFWAAVFLVQKFDWGHGVSKAVVMLALMLALPAVIALARHRSVAAPLPAEPRWDAAPTGAAPIWLRVLVGLLLAVQVAYFLKEMRHPHLIDVAATTLAAGHALLHGQNPYLLPLDPGSNPVAAGFPGYKYLPLMAVAYLPLGAAFGARGVLLTNLLLQLGVVWLLIRLLRPRAGDTAALLAAALYLGLPLVLQQVLSKGSTDLATVVPLLLALGCVERSGFRDGFWVGISIAVKLFPGLAFLPCLLPAAPRERWRYLAGIAVGLLPILPFALWSPHALFGDIILFNGLRPPDSTSWLAWASPDAALWARGAYMLLFLGVAAFLWRRPASLAVRAGLGAMLTIGVILCGPAAHHNYQLWWLPFYCLPLALALAPRHSADLPAGAGSDSSGAIKNWGPQT